MKTQWNGLDWYKALALMAFAVNAAGMVRAESFAQYLISLSFLAVASVALSIKRGGGNDCGGLECRNGISHDDGEANER